MHARPLRPERLPHPAFLLGVAILLLTFAPAAAQDSDEGFCGRYIGWSQPTQGTVQISEPFDRFNKPEVGDRLEIRDGYQFVIRGVPQGRPLLEAMIPLVSRRTTYLIGGSPVPDAASDNILPRSRLRFQGWMKGFYGHEQVTLRTRLLDAFGNLLLEFNPTRTAAGAIEPVWFPLVSGNCREGDEDQPFQVDFKVDDQAHEENAHVFGTGGTYYYETDVVRYVKERDNGWGADTGFGTVVKFKVVDTRIPKIAIYPTRDPQQTYPGVSPVALSSNLAINAAAVKSEIQKQVATHMPVAERDPSRKVSVAPITRILPQVVNGYEKLRLEQVQSAALGNFDLATYYVDQEGFYRLRGSRDAKGFAVMKNLAYIRGEATRGLFDSERKDQAGVFLHEFAHTTLVDLWSKEEMLETCGLDYHNQKEPGRYWGVSVIDETTGQPKDLTSFDFFRVEDFMSQTVNSGSFNPADYHANQCTWRHLTDVWSRPLIDPELIVVSGIIHFFPLSGKRGELGRVYHKVGDIKGPTVPGTYRIDLLDAFGSVLESHPFRVNAGHSETPLMGSAGVFKFELETPPGLYEVRLYENNDLLDTRRFTANAPAVGNSVTVTRVGADYKAGWVDLRLDWTVSDRDFFFMNPPVNTVQYSLDGQLYFETDAFEITQTTTVVRVPTSATELRIWTNDGARSDNAVFELNPFCWYFSSCTLFRR